MMMEAICPGCGKTFTPARRNQSYCGRECQKNAARGDRKQEHRAKSAAHYERARWLSHDLAHGMEASVRDWFIQTMLEAAADHDASLRAILLDPVLLGEEGRGDNCAKMVDRFCRRNYGMGTRDTIMDDGKPNHQTFVGEPIAEEAVEPNPDGTMQGPYAPVQVRGEVLGDDPAWMRIRGSLRGRMTDRRVGNRTKPVTGSLEPSGQYAADLARVDLILSEAPGEVLAPVPVAADAHVTAWHLHEDRMAKEGTVPWREWWAKRQRPPVPVPAPPTVPGMWASGRSMRAQADPLPPCLTGKPTCDPMLRLDYGSIHGRRA